jgi:polyferredoxin
MQTRCLDSGRGANDNPRLIFRANRYFMEVARPTAATGAAAMPRGLFFAGLLAAVLAVLFWKSFLPG